MVVAVAYDFFRTLHPKATVAAQAIAPLHVDSHGWIVLLVGGIVSFIVAYFVVAWFMHWVTRRGFVPFAVYRIVVGAAVLWWAAR
jgi:undecaprenyl-diphosphatase